MRIEWATPSGNLVALEPTPAQVATHAAALAASYNDPHNAPLMGHSDPFDAAEVIGHYQSMKEDGARAFLLFCDGQLAGDADLRGLSDGAAEFAFLVAAPSSQGKGLGTRFATMVHWFGFSQLGLHHLYASIAPANTASKRVFEKLGFALDPSPPAQAFVEAPGDLVMSIDRPTFERLHREALKELQIR